MSRSRVDGAPSSTPSASRVTARVVGAGTLLASVPATVFAHVETSPVGNPWTAWQFTPDIVLGTLFVCALYTLGIRARGKRQRPVPWWRHLSFFGGLLLIFAALQSPLDVLSEHGFAIHQLQHLLLHTAGPMFLMLAAPQILLTAGMPELLLRRELVNWFQYMSFRVPILKLKLFCRKESSICQKHWVWSKPVVSLRLSKQRTPWLRHQTLP